MKEHFLSSQRRSRKLTGFRLSVVGLIVAASIGCGVALSSHLGAFGAYLPVLIAALVNGVICSLWAALFTQALAGAIVFAVSTNLLSGAVPAFQIWSFLAFFVLTMLSVMLAESIRQLRGLVRSSQQMELIAEATHDCIWDWDLQTGYLWRGGKVAEIFGCAPEQVEPNIQWWRLRIDPDQQTEVWDSLQTTLAGQADRWDCEYRLHRDDGSSTIVTDRARILRNKRGVALRVLGGMADISATRKAEERLLHFASHDSLTGLLNRNVFLRSVEGQKARSTSRAIIFLDLDHFKAVNDSFGHQVGDELLVEVSQRLKNHLRPGDLAARFGADQFTILLDRVLESGDAVRVAKEILQSLSVAFHLAGRTVCASASIGVAVSNEGSHLDLLHQADLAMYQAKRQGPGRYQLFDPVLEYRARAHRQMEAELKQSFDDSSLRLHYQPIISLRTGALTSFEALLRWQHPRHGMVFPSEILPIAENSGLSIRLGQWVLKETCERLRSWQAQAASRRLEMNVNLSGVEFSRPDLVDEVRLLLSESGVPGESLIIELTETTIMESNVDAARRLSQLRDLGIRLALDDFGKGHSSLGRLQDFPISILKIDSAFVKQICWGKRQILDAIIALAHELKLEITAEGVETTQQLLYLRDKGAAKVQGLLFAPALAADAASELLLKPAWNLDDLLGKSSERSAGIAAGSQF